MLNLFITMKEEEKRPPKQRRPYLASECRDLAEADKLHQQIMREIGRKVAEIQNDGLGEHRIRDLNDEINKLIREKVHWERHIVELGGHNYSRHSAKMTDLDGNIVDVPNPSGKGPGYRYFGAAKKLPGVRELFEKPPELRKRRTRYDIYKRIDDTLVPPTSLLTGGNAQELLCDSSRRVSASGRHGNSNQRLPQSDTPESSNVQRAVAGASYLSPQDVELILARFDLLEFRLDSMDRRVDKLEAIDRRVTKLQASKAAYRRYSSNYDIDPYQQPTRFRPCHEQPPGWPPPQRSPPSCWPAQRRRHAYERQQQTHAYRQQQELIAAHMDPLNRFRNSPAATTQSRSGHEQPTVVLQPLLSPTSLQRSAIPPMASVAVPPSCLRPPSFHSATKLVSCEEKYLGIEGDSKVLNQVDLRLNEKKLVDEEVQAIEVDKIDDDDGLHDSSKIATFDFDGCLPKTSVKGVNADTWSVVSPSIPEKLHNRYKDELQDAREDTVDGLKDKSIYSRMGVKRMGELDNKPFHVTIMRMFVEDVYIEYAIVGYWRLKQRPCTFTFDPGGDKSPKLLLSTLRCFVVSTLRTRWILTVGELLRAYYYYYLV